MIRLFASLICGCALVLAAAVPMAGQSPVFESMGGPAYKVVTVVDGLQDRLMVYTGDRFPKWRGSIFVGGLTGQQLVRLALTGADGHQIGMMDRPHLLLGYARIRDVRQGPDGYIYLVTDGRYETRPQRIVRLEPAGP
jgi:hypothetical protein